MNDTINNSTDTLRDLKKVINNNFIFFKNQNEELFFVYENDIYILSEDNLCKLLILEFEDLFGRSINQNLLSQTVKAEIAYQSFHCTEQLSTCNRLHIDRTSNTILYYLNDVSKNSLEISENSIKYIFDEFKYGIAFESKKYSKEQVFPKSFKMTLKDARKQLLTLKNFINTSDENFKMIIIYILCAFIKDIPHPILIILGGAGTSKSTTTTFLNELIDPSINEIMSLPKKDDLELVLSNRYFVAFDNIGENQITKDVSDLLCQAVTGATVVRRKKYTDKEETYLKLNNVIVFNGITPNIFKEDLLQRSIVINMNPIDIKERRLLSDIRNEFRENLPKYLEAIAVVLQHYLKNSELPVNQELSRMADFEYAGIIFSKIMFNDETIFSNLYKNNLKRYHQKVVELDSIVAFIQEYIEIYSCIEGTPSYVFDSMKRSNSSKCPATNVNSFFTKVYSKEKELHSIGILVEHSHSKERYVKISKTY